jgi:hypothetical protein
MRGCAILFACAAAFAQQSAVRCTVVEAGSGQPLEGVQAQLVASRSGTFATEAYGAVTGRDGRFSVAPIPAGSYLVIVQKPGYLGAMRRRGGMTPGTVSVKAGETTEGCRFEMTRRSGISGRVTDANGDPVGNVRMVVLTPEGEEASWPGAVSYGVTDSRGEYRLAPAAGRYRIKADVHSTREQEDPDEIRTDGTAEIVYGPTTYPHVVDARPGGELTGIDIRLAPWQAGVISGVVTGAAPGERATILYWGRIGGGTTGDSTTAAGDGSFALKQLRQGSYWLSAQTDSGGRSAPVAVELGDTGVSGVRLAIARPFDVAGTVAMPAGRMAAGVQVEAVGVPEFFNMRRIYDGAVARDGTFRIEKVQAGKYRLRVLPGAADLYVKSPAGILDFENPAGPADLKVTVADGAARISGTVENETGPLTHGFVYVTLTAESGLVEELRAQDATYSFPGLAPGKYRLRAVDPASGRSVEVAVELQPGDRLVKTLKVADAR